MHIIFGYVSYWHIPVLRVLKFFKLNVFYLYVDAKTKIKKNVNDDTRQNEDHKALPFFERSRLHFDTVTLRMYEQ